MNRSLAGLALVAVLIVGGGLTAQDAAEPAEKAAEEAAGKIVETGADRLMKAELLEVSSGELEKAMEIYSAIAAEEDASAEVRARAKLYLGRCLRKRGELERAKKVLAEVVESFPDQTDVVRRARGYLKELESGKAENPRFDWIGDLQRNPEIQARIFDWIMDLVDPGEGQTSDKARIAGRQLLAIGTVALPMLEQAAGSSRDPAHRRRVALILIHLGRHEYLDAALPPAHDYWDRYEPLLESLVESVLSATQAERDRLRKALEAQPEAGKTGGIRDLLLVAAGERSDLAARLARFEGRSVGGGIQTLPRYYGREEIVEQLASEETGQAALAARILDPAARENTPYEYLRLLEERAPERLAADHYLACATNLARRGGNMMDLIPELEKRGALARLLESPEREAILLLIPRIFDALYVRPNRMSSAPAEWAVLLRAAGELAAGPLPVEPRPVPPRRPSGNELVAMAREARRQLLSLAQVNDGAIGECLVYLRSERFGVDDLPVGEFTPSAAYAEAMATLLECENPAAIILALESLSNAPAGVGPEVVDELEKLVLDPPDLHLHELAIHALLRRFTTRPETGPEVARILLADYAQRAGKDVPEEYFTSPLAGFTQVGQIQRAYTFHLVEQDSGLGREIQILATPGAKRVGPRPKISSLRFYSSGEPSPESWVFPLAGQAALTEIHPFLLPAARLDFLDRDPHSLYGWIYIQLDRRVHVERLVRDLAGDRITDRAVVIRGLEILRRREREVQDLLERDMLRPELLDLMKSVALDSSGEISVELRFFAVELFQWRGSATWFDWPELLNGDDPLAGRLADLVGGIVQYEAYKDDEDVAHGELLGSSFSSEQRRAIFRAALESSSVECREVAYGCVDAYVEDPAERLEIYRKGARDPEVQRSLFLHLMDRGAKKEYAEILALTVRWGNWFFPQTQSIRTPQIVIKAIDKWPSESRALLAEVAAESVNAQWRWLFLTDDDLFSSLEDPFPILEKLIQDVDDDVRNRAVDRLLGSRSVKAVPLLSRLADQSQDAQVRANIARCLANIDTQESLAPLARLAEDENTEVRNLAIQSLETVRARLEARERWDGVIEKFRAKEKEETPDAP
ncbi:MAG: HEAT repeat domain-containing protein [Planctomycetes bacterium]|nr:HEAT repeat domain-containing protein [Planctomycetota bacterium]